LRHGVATEGLFATKDSQASVLLLPHSIVAPAGQRSVALTLEPVAPPANATVPNGESITGNVYRIQAVFEPSGKPVQKLEKQAILTLIYPALAGAHHVRRVLASQDGVRFTEISSIDSTVQEQVTAHVRSLGYFGVGVRAVSVPTPGPPSGGSGFPTTLVVVAAAVAVALVIGWLRWRERRAARSSRHRRPAPRRRR
jgi:hypothetical protein